MTERMIKQYKILTLQISKVKHYSFLIKVSNVNNDRENLKTEQDKIKQHQID